MQRFTGYIILIALLAGGLLLIYRSLLSEGRLIKIEGKVLQKQIEPVSVYHGNYRFGLTFRIENYDTKFGIYTGVKRQESVNKLIDTGKVYIFLIDPTIIASNGINLGIRAIELKGKKIYYESQNFTLFLGLFFTLTSSIGFFVINKYKRKNN